ncbi:MAG: tRNA (adenosine(37)-N6)-dimethylallyltransferase MiaA [Caldiserica bacterium]|nr:MAG: tRNA (adenosine(37)-N6)-dimethylallyltransferase MiaA [Caldisericota bacterium]
MATLYGIIHLMRTPLIVITGPTAVGKTEISILVAKEISGEIISFDAFQVYRFMNIGTNKIKKEEMRGIPHHMIDVVNPNEEFSSGRFKEMAEKIIDSIYKGGKIPVLVGGTGLYLRTLLSFEPPGSKKEVRKKIEEEVEKLGLNTLYEKLKRVDPVFAGKVSPKDRKRIIRGLEVYEIYKKPISSFFGEEERYDALKFILLMDRKKLYKRIEDRVDRMFDMGFVDEVKRIKEYWGFSKTSKKAIGYEEILLYLSGEISLEECKRRIKKRTKEYARRQIIWLRKEKGAIIIDVTDKNPYELAEEILRKVKEKWKNL